MYVCLAEVLPLVEFQHWWREQHWKKTTSIYR